ncbi:methylmalonyl-CoA epimerase [Priestia koreensis]|uniref:methylmalonyl-CoA epimerase n=1 Tax=Priestia koreensis TaxID=284581 RepID=UPI001F599CA7|nr:methylmalonyl-CoA epimerase [Priestia koreensis]MCM3002392.1 methylmalonyl-CoA epimerase [Priestia koreensis]UNL84116.1 methylmalonyl-CoA epimerase [Priestia koreensis]
MVEKVDHIGIAVQSIESALPFYVESLGLTLIGTEVVESQKVKVAFLNAGNVKLELLEPTADNSPIAAFIAKRGEGIHHIAVGVTSIEERIHELQTNGVKMIDLLPRKGAAGANIAFLHPKSASGVLYELCEKQKEEA